MDGRNFIRYQAHNELRTLSEYGKEVVTNILFEKLKEFRNDNWKHGEFVYSLGCIEPKSKELKTKIKERMFEILELDNRAETIGNCLAVLDFSLGYPDIARLKELQEKVSQKK